MGNTIGAYLGLYGPLARSGTLAWQVFGGYQRIRTQAFGQTRAVAFATDYSAISFYENSQRLSLNIGIAYHLFPYQKVVPFIGITSGIRYTAKDGASMYRYLRTQQIMRGDELAVSSARLSYELGRLELGADVPLLQTGLHARCGGQLLFALENGVIYGPLLGGQCTVTF